MKLYSYMLKKFFGIFFGAMMFFIMILELVSLFANLWSYISRGTELAMILKIMLYYVPRCVWYSIPMSMLFATAYMLSDLYAKNELLAIFASGVSLFKFTLPLLIFSIFMSVGLFFFEDRVVVKYQVKYDETQAEALHKRKSLNNDNVVILSEEGRVVYDAAFYDSETKRLYTLYVVFRGENNELEGILYAESATWLEEEQHWDIQGAKFYTKENDFYTAKSVPQNISERMTEAPETFENKSISVTEVTARKAREYIEHLEKAGLPAQEAKAEYYKKFAFPFIVFIVVFLAIGLSGKTRKNVLLISLALSIAAVVVFYVTQMVTMLMAKFGVIPPLMGEWFPVMLFTVIAAVLLKYART